MYLKGAAAIYYKGLLDGTKQDWDLLSHAFLDQYNDADARNLQITKLSKIRQTPNESVMQFGARLKQMALMAYEGMNANQVEPLLLAHYLQGLKPDIKRHVILRAPVDLAEAERTAKTVELNVGLYDVNRELNQSKRDYRAARVPYHGRIEQYGGYQSEAAYQRPNSNFNNSGLGRYDQYDTRSRFDQRPRFIERTKFEERPRFEQHPRIEQRPRFDE